MGVQKKSIQPYVSIVILIYTYIHTFTYIISTVIQNYLLLFTLVDEIIYTNWGITDNVFEPTNGKDCAKICSSSGCDYTWRGIDCSDPLPYICEIDLVCPEGWAGFQDSCYKLEKWKSTHSEWADDTCMMSHDCDLAVPNSNEEAQFLSDFINAKAVSF